MNLMPHESLSTPEMPALVAVISSPWSTALSHWYTGMAASTVLLSESDGSPPTSATAGSASRCPVFVPGSPILPMRMGSMQMAREVSSPLVWRCGPQPCMMNGASAAAISFASARMVSAGICVMGAAHSGVFSTMS